MEEVEDIELISTPAPEEAVENNGNDIELTMSEDTVPVSPVSEDEKAEEVETTRTWKRSRKYDWKNTFKC